MCFIQLGKGRAVAMLLAVTREELLLLSHPGPASQQVAEVEPSSKWSDATLPLLEHKQDVSILTWGTASRNLPYELRAKRRLSK